MFTIGILLFSTDLNHSNWENYILYTYLQWTIVITITIIIIITQHIQDLIHFIFSDKEQLLEIAKANAAAMCAKAGMPIPASLRTSALPFALPSMAMNAAMASMTAGMIWILFLF